jgi:hypothetical protein
MVLGFTGATSLATREMRAPGLAGDLGLYVRMHEMLHARYSPIVGPEAAARRAKVDSRALAIAEDVRMTALGGLLRVTGIFRKLAQHGALQEMCDADPGFGRRITELLVEGFRYDLPAALNLAMSIWLLAAGTRDAELAEKLVVDAKDIVVEKHGGDDVMLTRVILQHRAAVSNVLSCGPMPGFPYGTASRAIYDSPRRHRLPGFKQTIELAKLIEKLIIPPLWKEPHEDEDETKRPGTPGGRDRKDLRDRDYEAVKRRKSEGIGWGKMSVELPPLREVHEVRHKLRQVTALDVGERIGDVHRVLTDGFVFREVRRRVGGTVLIDTSGSMGVTAGQVREMVKAAPAVKVAVYGAPGGREGILRVVADRGRMAEAGAAYSAGAGNVVDGPALRWLLTQRGPRVWVSDGQVTGVGDVVSAPLTAEAMTIARMGRVTRIGKADAVNKALGANRRSKR